MDDRSISEPSFLELFIEAVSLRLRTFSFLEVLGWKPSCELLLKLQRAITDGWFNSSLVNKEFSPQFRDFMRTHGIRHCVIEMQGTKKVEIPESVMQSIMEVVLDDSNHPLLIHCNHGKVVHTFQSCWPQLIHPAAPYWLRCCCCTPCCRMESRRDCRRIYWARRTQSSRVWCSIHYGVSSIQSWRIVHQESYA